MPATLERAMAFSNHHGCESLKTQGEIEAAICDAVSQFASTHLGRGPKDIRAHLIRDLLVVRLQGVLTSVEKHLVSRASLDKGRELLKEYRSQLIEGARLSLESLVREITGVKLRSLHHDISTRSDEEVVIFTLAEAPRVRDSRK